MRPSRALLIALTAAFFTTSSPAQMTGAPGWAQEALDRLGGEGLVQGYPQLGYQGRRAATRYEMAVLAYDVWRSIEVRLASLRPQGATDPQSGDLKGEIEEVKGQVELIRALSDDLVLLKKLLLEFEPELTQLGLDYEILRRELKDLEPRVSWLEAHPLPLKISGDLTTLMLGGDSGGGNFGFDTAGRPLGFGRGTNKGVGQNSTRDLTVFDEFSLNLQNLPSAKTPWHATLVTGNTLGGLAQGSTLSGTPYTEAASTLYLQSFGVQWQRGRATGVAGRIAESGNQYLLSKPDTTPQLELKRWDSQGWVLDGLKGRFAFGDSSLELYGGRTAPTSVTGPALQALTFGRTGLPWTPGGPRPVGLLPGAQKVDTLSGANLRLESERVVFRLNYEYLLSSSSMSGNAGDNGRAYAASFTAGENAWFLNGGYAKTDLLAGGSNLVTRHNQAAWVDAATGVFHGRLGVQAGYKYVEPLFGGAGDWGRIGMWWNPTDLKGPNAKVWASLAPHLLLTATGSWSQGTGLNVAGVTGLQTSDHLHSYKLDLERDFQKWKATASYETVDWDLKDRPGFTGGHPSERWYGLALKRDTPKLLLSLAWLLSDIDSKGVAGFQMGAAQKARGSLVSAQATVRF